MSSNIFDRLSFLSLFLVIVLLPLFTLPFTNIPVETSKGLLLIVGLALSIVFWAIARFFDGKIVLPKSGLLLAGGGIVLVVLISALVSKNLPTSLFGTMFDLGSFWFIFAGFLLLFMSSLIFRTPAHAKLVLFGIILSSFVVLAFQALHLFMPDALSLGILSGKTGNVFGSWNALGLFAGFAALMFLLQLEFFPLSKIGRLLLQFFVVLSVLIAATVNFPLVWILLGISALIIFVYKASASYRLDAEGDKDKRFPAMSFIVVIISLLFFISGQFIGSIIPNYLKISNSEVGPSLSATMSVTKKVLSKDPILGLGPNKFAEAWSMYKPASVNSTQFWDVAFNSGSGVLPTLTATTGVLGIAAWIFFLILFLTNGIRSVFSGVKNSTSWEITAFFVLSLYLYISMFFYSTGMVIFLLALAFTGTFIGLSASSAGREISVSFLNDHRKSFFSIMGLIVLCIFSVAGTFKFLERFASVSYFGKALSAETVPLAENFIGRALSLHTNDLYLRTYSQIYLVKLDSLVKKGSALTEEEKADLQKSFDQAVRSAELAVVYNPSNYVNYKLLGSVYQTAGVLGVKDAYPKAVQAYENASKLNPLNPGIKIAISSALSADGKTKEAITYAEEALALVPNDKSIQEYINSLKNKTSVPPPVPETNTPKQ